MPLTGTGVTVTGLSDLIRELRAADPALPRELTRVQATAARVVAATARTTAPRLTGRLAGSVRPLASQRSARVQAGRGVPRYAPVIHFGWPGHNIEPQPFLFEALRRDTPRVVRIFQQGVTALLRRIGL